MTNNTRDDSTPIVFKVLKQISKMLGEFTPRQRVFAEYVLQYPESVAFLSITDLAKEAGVSQATIVRFCNMLGYNGYTQLSREAQQSIQVELGSAGRFRVVHGMRRESTKKKAPSIFESVLECEIENLINLSKNIKTTDFYLCMDMMAEADLICIVGCMGSSCLATFFGDMLSKFFPRVKVLHAHSVMTSAVYQQLTENSLVFLISFPLYARETLDLGRLAAEKGARIVVITDSNTSPVVTLATLSFFVRVKIHSYVESYSAPIAFINALITELSERSPEKTEEALLRYDDYTSQMNIYKVSRAQLASNKNS